MVGSYICLTMLMNTITPNVLVWSHLACGGCKRAAGLHSEAEVGGDGWEDLAGSWRVRVHWTGEERRMQAAGNLVSTKRDSAWEGRVVARNAARGLHRVRYDDGAEELADLGIISFDTLAGEPS